MLYSKRRYGRCEMDDLAQGRDQMCNARRPDVQVPLTRTSRYAARWRLRDRAIGGRVRLALLVAIPALSLTSWAPVPQAFASGSSSPILSGYGSPGANMQAILGDAEARR